MGQAAADAAKDNVDEEEIPADSVADSEGPAASSVSQDAPAGSESSAGGTTESSSGDGPAASSEDGGGPQSSDSEGPAASESMGPGPESTADSMPDSLQSSAQSSGPDGSSSDAYMRKIALKKGAQSRYQMYLMCNMFEQAAREMLKFALENGLEKQKALDQRDELLKALYYLRHISDVDDEFTNEEYEQEMLNVKKFRTKMGRLAAKEDENQDSDADSSSDDEIDDADDMDLLKEARKQMEFCFGRDEKK